jgi:prefoldin subunit 5
VKDVLERTELVLQELDRKIEGVNARHGNDLRSLREEVESLRASVEALRREANVSSTPGAGIPADAPEPGVPAGARPASDR